MELIHGQSNANPGIKSNIGPLYIKIRSKKKWIYFKGDRWCKNSNEKMSCKLVIRIDREIHKISNKSLNKLNLTWKSRNVRQSNQRQKQEKEKKVIYILFINSLIVGYFDLLYA